MKTIVSITTAAAILAGGSLASVYAQTKAHVISTVKEAQWGPAPPMLPPGAEIAVLAGNRSEARRAVRSAVELAEPAGWTRVFIDEGEVIGSLLTEAYANGPTLDSATDRFATKLVAVMHGGRMLDEESSDFGLSSRLASREVDILTMVSGGLRNREIGDRLGLTEGTVKWYMQQIYDKLGVRRRPQAVIRARQLGILP